MKHFSGIAHGTAEFLQKNSLCDRALFRRFVDVFRTRPDSQDRAWRGEYWGKMMRGACLVLAYTEDSELYDVLTETVCDILTTAEEDGRVSSYTRETEFTGWDMWSRKYVLLGLEYYLDVCRDEALAARIVRFLSECADYILAHIGEGKRDITETARHWYGMNSSSILEPIVRLYRLTKEERYLDFATYIVERGGTNAINIFELAYVNKLLPYQYGVSKAYEMISCFEGLLDYYYATGIEKHKTAVIRFAEALLSSEISIIGSCGLTHELFDHTAARQTAKPTGVMQETCVTVTLMKFLSRMLALTGEAKYADAVERSFYNAYLGALNTELTETAYMRNRFPEREVRSTILPFDSYSPLTPGRRGLGIGGSLLLPNGSYYGCCACIGAAGVGVFLENAITVTGDTVTVNFYENGTATLLCAGAEVTITVKTDYPIDGRVEIAVLAERPTAFTLRLRTPAFADGKGGYVTDTRVWHRDSVMLSLAMPLTVHRPAVWDEDLVYTKVNWGSPGKFCEVEPVRVTHTEEDDRYFAVTRGPLTLAADSRTGKPADSPHSPPKEVELCEPRIAEGVSCLLKLSVTPEEGEPYCLVDYASAGRDWKALIAAWLPTAE